MSAYQHAMVRGRVTTEGGGAGHNQERSWTSRFHDLRTQEGVTGRSFSAGVRVYLRRSGGRSVSRG